MADRLLAIDPRGRGVLSQETLTRRGEDILPALHFTFRLILSQGGRSHEQGRRACMCVHKHEHTSINLYTGCCCGLSQTLSYAATHTHADTCSVHGVQVVYRGERPLLCILLRLRWDIEVNKRRVATCSSALHVSNSVSD